VRAEGEGGVWVYLSLEEKNKRENFASSFTSPDFFFKKFYVMKCLRSKKKNYALLFSSGDRRPFFLAFVTQSQGGGRWRPQRSNRLAQVGVVEHRVVHWLAVGCRPLELHQPVHRS